MNYENISNEELNEKKEKLRNEISFCNVQQTVRKTLCNALYGAIANTYCRFYDLRIPTSITLTGQTYIKRIAINCNEYLKKYYEINDDCFVYSDTDSTFFTLYPILKKLNILNESKEIIAKKYCVEICNLLNDFIVLKFEEYGKEYNIFENLIKMKRENICDRALWVAKKRYIYNVLIDEAGIYNDQRKFKIKGLELVKSSTPRVVREKLKECIKFILANDNDGLIKFIKKFKKEFMDLDPTDISFPRSANELNKWTIKNKNIHNSIKLKTPIAVKGAIYYNLLLDINGSKDERIKNKSKIKFCYLKNNPYKLSVISFPNDFPLDLIEKKYVNYEMQFEKTFIDPIKMLINPLNWSVDNKNQKLIGFFKE